MPPSFRDGIVNLGFGYSSKRGKISGSCLLSSETICVLAVLLRSREKGAFPFTGSYLISITSSICLLLPRAPRLSFPMTGGIFIDGTCFVCSEVLIACNFCYFGLPSDRFLSRSNIFSSSLSESERSMSISLKLLQY